MATPDIEQYKMSNGYYSTAKIRTDAGMDDRSAFFLDIFGSFDDDGKDTGGDLPSEWQTLLEEAERLNKEREQAEKQAAEQEALSLVRLPEPWSRETWKRLAQLGYASRDVDDGGEQGWRSVTYILTERGERLLDPQYRAAGLYDDQRGIDG